MKIVISRKGFDSGYGGVPSPVLPDGRLVSLPIPSAQGSAARSGRARELCLGKVMADLTSGRLNGDTLIHVDPDLDPSTLPRRTGWHPSFGQVGAAQTHLRNQGVGVGDLFLFFGWFRPAELQAGRWRYVAGEKSFHGLFGWLRVGEVVDVDAVGAHAVPAWLADHPHVAHAPSFVGQRNTVYVAADRLRLGRGRDTPGGGMFGRWSPALKLTAAGQSISVWRVPEWFAPRDGRPALSYHGRPDRWIRQGTELHLRSVAKGQEFVLDTEHYPEATEWAHKLIEEHA